jgi:hypothetical protein
MFVLIVVAREDGWIEVVDTDVVHAVIVSNRKNIAGWILNDICIISLHRESLDVESTPFAKFQFPTMDYQNPSWTARASASNSVAGPATSTARWLRAKSSRQESVR